MGVAECTWLAGVKHSSVSIQHSLIDQFLLRSKLAVGRKRACNVRSVTVVLSTHVKQTAYSIQHTHTHTHARAITLQCFHTVGWATRRASGL